MPRNVIPVSIKMNIDGKEAVGELTLGLKEFQKAVNAAQKTAGNDLFNKAIVQAGAFASAITGLNAAITDLAASYNSFDKSMREANTMAGKGAEDFAKLKDQVVELSKTIPLAREELASGLYQVISNGVPEDNWMSFLEQSSKSAVGGIANLGEVVKVTSTIIKNYGLDWSAAGDIQDKIQLTAKRGVTSFEQLAASLPSVTGQAAQLGVSFSEMLAVMSTLTGVTGNTSEVSTQLASVLTALTKESTKAQKAAAEMGIEFNAASIKAAGGLQPFLQELDATVKAYAAKTGQLSESIYSKLFGRAEALRLVNALTGEMANKFTENIGAMVDSAGTINAAFDETASTAEAKAQITSNSWTEVTDKIGECTSVVKPYLATLSQIAMIGIGFSPTITTITNLGKGIKVLGNEASVARTKFLALGTGMKVALISSGIGLAIVALSSAIAYFAGKTEEAADKVNEAAKRTKKFKDELEAMSKDLRDVTTESSRMVAKEMSSIDTLVVKIKDETRSKKERLAALKELQSRYPLYFSNLSIENLNVAELIRNYNRLKVSLVEVARARAAQDKLTDVAGKMIDNEQRLDEAKKNLERVKEAAEEQKKIVGAVFDDWGVPIEEKDSFGLPKYSDADKRVAAGTLKFLETEQSRLENEVQQYEETAAELNSVQEYLMSVVEGTKNPNMPTNPGPVEPDKSNLSLDEVKGRIPKTIEEFESKLSDLNKLRKRASKEQLAYINEVIAAVEAEKKAFEGVAEASAPTLDEIRTRALPNLDAYSKALQDLAVLRGKATKDEIADIDALIKKIEEEKEAFEGVAKVPAPTLDEIRNRALPNLEAYEKALQDLRTLRLKATKEELAAIDAEIAKMEKSKASFEGLSKENPFAKMGGMDLAKSGFSAIGDIESGLRGMSKLLSDNASLWDRLKGAISGTFQVIEGMQSVLGVLEALGIITKANTVAQEASVVSTIADASAKTEAAVASGVLAAESPAEVAANVAETAAAEAATSAFLDLAAAKIFAAHAAIPFAGVGIASGNVSAMLAMMGTVKGFSMFADGGIVYSPTLGLFGEYPGASHNPEIVAPLDKLRSMLHTESSGVGQVEFEIRGDRLYGVLKKYMNHLSRTK